MPEQSDYESALSKGERFFERGNFPLAKRELEVAHRLRPSDEIAEKLRQCEAGIVVQDAKEAAKRGRKLEKKGKLAEALKQFEQAQAAAPEDWLPQKIDQLRQRIGHDAIVATIAHAERLSDWDALLTTYEETLAGPRLSDTERQVFCEKKLLALVRLERYDEARAWAQAHPPIGASACYHLGYARAACGAYLDALNQWLDLPPGNPVLQQQIAALIPLAYHEMNELAASVPADLYDRLLLGTDSKDKMALASFLAHFKLRSIDTLWRQEKYQEVARYMLPLPLRLSLSELGFYAPLLLQLAEEDTDQLQTAISLWLTAIYNTPLLERILARRAVSTLLRLDVLRGALQQELEHLLDRHDREGRLDKRLQRHYQVEKRVIEALAAWDLPHETDLVWPCTPAFAARFGLSKTVLERIEAWRGRDAWDESVLSVAVYFSTSGHSLLLAEAGAVDEALAELPRVVDNDRLGRYCRQRVAWLCGIDRTLAGNAKGKSYFMEALPLLVDFPHYRKELIDIALGESLYKERFTLADAMEWLARQLNDAEFREATATLLCQKANFLIYEDGSKEIYKRLTDQAASLCPNSYLVKDTYIQISRAQHQDQLYKALNKGKLNTAVAVIERSGRDDELIEIFFSALNYCILGLESLNTKSQLLSLRDFLFYTRQVDPNHPINSTITSTIARLEK